MSLQNFAWALFSTSPGTIIVSPKRNWKQFLCKILEGQQRVLWYFWKRPITSRQPASAFVTDKNDKRFELGTNPASGQNENKILDWKSDALTTGPCCLSVVNKVT